MSNAYNSSLTGALIDNLDTRIITANSLISNNNSSISGLDTRLTTAEGTISSLNTRLTTVENRTIEENYFLAAHPINSVMIMSTNTAPQYGTWTLIDKGFKYLLIADFTPTLNTTNCSAATVGAILHGENITLKMSFTNKVILTDTATELFTISPNIIGLNGAIYARNLTAFSDGGNVVLSLTISSAGVVKCNDVLQRNNTAASLAADTSISNLYFTLSTTNYSYMLDSFCDKFYFKRTA